MKARFLEPAKRAFRYLDRKVSLARRGILEINLEFSNVCNLRCVWCSLDHGMAKSFMTEDVLRKVLDDLMTDRAFRTVRRILLWSGGETMLHPRFIDMMAILKEYKSAFLQQRRRFPTVSLLTNGMTLRPQMAGRLVELDVVDLLRFSVDGGSREMFEEIRRGAKWDVIAKNIRDFVETNQGRIKTGIICVIEHGRKKSFDWMTEEFRELLELVDYVELRYPHDFIGNVAVPGLPPKAFQRRCYFLDHSMVVLPNGDVTVCCVDLNGIGAIGNLGQQDLGQIYMTRKRLEMIGHLKRGEREKVDLCRNCSGYGY